MSNASRPRLSGFHNCFQFHWSQGVFTLSRTLLQLPLVLAVVLILMTQMLEEQPSLSSVTVAVSTDEHSAFEHNAS